MFHSYKALIRNPRLALAAGIGAAAVLQLANGWIDPYTTQVILFAAINVILAVSLNLVMGETGQFSLCHAAFMAVGAYTSALLTGKALPVLLPHLSWTGSSWATQIAFLPVLLIGGAVAALAGFIVGGPSLRLRGDYPVSYTHLTLPTILRV